MTHNAADKYNVWKIRFQHHNYSFLGCEKNKRLHPLRAVCDCFLISCLLLSPPVLPLFAAPLCTLQYQAEGSRPHLSKLDLEQWYRELMAGSRRLCPPPLPAQSQSGRRPVLQVEGPFFFLLFQLRSHSPAVSCGSTGGGARK